MSAPPPTYDASLSTLRPYLELPHILSLAWLAYPILSLLFVAFRLQISLASSQDAVSDARGDLLTSCKAAEQAATAASSLPRYMAIATNQQFVDAVNGTMNGARAALVLSLTIMETIINFIVDLYRSTFLCFLELVVRGGLSILIGAVQELSQVVTAAANGIRTSIQSDITSANSAITTVINAANKINPFGNITPPQITVPDLTSLENVTIPADFQNALISLNNSLPTLSELKDAVEQLIDTPFELVKADINDTFANMTFDVSLFPVPAQNTLSFCGQLDTSVVDDLGNDIIKTAKIGVIILVLLAALLLAGNCALEWYKWRCLKKHLQYTREAWTTDPTIYKAAEPVGMTPTVTMSDHNLMMLQASSAHPLLTRIANTIAAKLRLSPITHTHLQWFLHYVFHPPALACFCIGLFGLLSVELQLLAVGPLEAKFQDRAQSSVADFSNTIATQMNASMFNQSSEYANGVNARVLTVQQTINDGLFGWVNGTTSSLNQTLNTFYDDVQNAVTKVFNGTVLESPMQEFVQCFIGSKVDAFENALTFLHNNLNVDLPTVNETILVLSPSDVNEATQPIATAAIGGGSGDSQGVVGKIINAYVNSLKKERIMFGVFMGLWGLVVLMGLGILLWHTVGRRMLENRRRRKWRHEQRAGITSIAIPFRGMPSPTATDGEKTGGLMVDNGARDLQAFTPLPSPLRHTKELSDMPASQPFHWDSLDNEERGKPSIVKAKLKAIGRKALGKERFIAESSEVKRDEGQESGWFDKVPGKWWRRTGSTETVTPQVTVDTASITSSQRTRPNLQITVDTIADQASVRGPDRSIIPGPPPQAARMEPREHTPKSAWSLSPTPTKPAWSTLVPKMVATHTPLRTKPRHAASVPADADSIYGGFSDDPRKSTQTSRVPLHHAFPSPPPSAYPPGLPTPSRDQHRRSTSAFTWVPATPLVAEGVTPPRRKSISGDPFATPFDDEHATGHTTAGKFRSSVRNSNPFAPMAF